MKTFEQAMLGFGYYSLDCKVIGNKVYISCIVGDKEHQWVAQGNTLIDIDNRDGPLPPKENDYSAWRT